MCAPSESAYAYVCMKIKVKCSCMCMKLKARETHSTFLNYFPAYFLDTVSLTELTDHRFSQGSEIQGSSYLCFPVSAITDTVHTWCFMWVLEIWT